MQHYVIFMIMEKLKKGDIILEKKNIEHKPPTINELLKNRIDFYELLISSNTKKLEKLRNDVDRTIDEIEQAEIAIKSIENTLKFV